MKVLHTELISYILCQELFCLKVENFIIFVFFLSENVIQCTYKGVSWFVNTDKKKFIDVTFVRNEA